MTILHCLKLKVQERSRKLKRNKKEVVYSGIQKGVRQENPLLGGDLYTVRFRFTKET